MKVFVVPVGFHDAYVAAPSRKAALAAWGSDHDLFARGIAHEVTDPKLAAEPLANPGKVVKRSRGTAAEQVAALPPEAPRAAKPAKAERPRNSTSKAPAPSATPVKPEPKPSREKLDDAEQALAAATKRHRAEDKALAERQADLDRDKRTAMRAHAEEQESLAETRDTERGRYDRAMKRWRAH